MMSEKINRIIQRHKQAKTRKFEVTFKGPHKGQPSIVVADPTEEERKKIYRIMNARNFDDPLYHISRNSGAFLQSDGPDYMLIEFWADDYQPFVDWLNS